MIHSTAKSLLSAKILSVFIAVTCSFSLASAITITPEPTAEKFEDVAVLKSSTIELSEKESVNLTNVSYGMRKKAVFGLVPVRVYVLQFLAAHPEKLVKTTDGILGSLEAAGPVQLFLTFSRDLPGPKISDAFKEGLETNKVNVKKLSLEMQQVLTEISAMQEFKKGESFAVTVIWNGPQATIHLQDPKGTLKSITGPKEFAEQFLSIWFGKASDGKLNDLKKELIK